MGQALKIDDSLSYKLIDDKDVFMLISTVREGIKYALFQAIAAKSPFSTTEWSGFLHLSERTFQRYKKEKRTFDPLHSEKILEITLVYNKGVEVFGDKANFDAWLEARNVALGGIKPKELLDNTFGIGLLKDELTRIEHGVLA
ncbi:putative toxin-antitoxin system antitoxin component (TIGR02293 family) [Pontibacter ummariensis]|uniref:Putative toxin-antitoxin system antitoxin component, TIGR02293 family n=1 Tax=Pontibacter ummariensis TaxID=1610492 RepID=A0A239FPM9_9BACT|nr:antitoxin Xre-like helix-turn-helix domain-containing protein [Pontibacter ummariensis]PRY11976.1 putative toxin-antitoxin system antitoxin component (TIGR02293 family) [Pontibacter ummariensis]SNS58877.1 putative toxin-antitoxin system antitoxin component, TIGR02293 family [Pontibacter ummariensis]